MLKDIQKVSETLDFDSELTQLIVPRKLHPVAAREI
jgi:hypothetical protein